MEGNIMNILTENKNYLNMVNDINTVSKEVGKKFYVWGGFVQDILEGKFIREHKDLDMFAEDLELIIDKVIGVFEKLEYECQYNNDISMLRVDKNNKHIGINPLEIKYDVAIWKHIGQKGFVIFPKDWLDQEPRIFYDTKVLTAGYKFEYTFRKIAKYLNPKWNERDKDKEAKEYYKNILDKNKIKEEDLLKKIWSYNPFWLEYGYNGYESPVLVLGKDYIKE
jgi:hypothetical protein